jgi:hypothetical protein
MLPELHWYGLMVAVVGRTSSTSRCVGRPCGSLLTSGKIWCSCVGTGEAGGCASRGGEGGGAAGAGAHLGLVQAQVRPVRDAVEALYDLGHLVKLVLCTEGGELSSGAVVLGTEVAVGLQAGCDGLMLDTAGHMGPWLFG